MPIRQGYSDAEASGIDVGAFGNGHTCWDRDKYQYELYLADDNLNVYVNISWSSPGRGPTTRARSSRTADRSA